MAGPLMMLTAALLAAPVPGPVRILFDTDLGNDIDDALALAMCHTLADRGECELLAVTLTKDNPLAGPAADLINRFYGRPVPVGVCRSGVTPEEHTYLRPLVECGLPYELRDGRDAPDAVPLLRRLLAAQPDDSVAAVQIGFSTNLSDLLRSAPDEHSPLAGVDLVRQKVRLLSLMGGIFDPAQQRAGYGEYNLKMDLPSAQALLAAWPTQIVVSGYEIGSALLYPARSIEQDYQWAPVHPVVVGYRHYIPMPYDRPTWDLTSLLHAVRPDHGYFDVSPPGVITIDERAVTHFQGDPAGRHRYLLLRPSQQARVLEALQLLSSQPLRSVRVP
ncbi:MAG: nucleoside hydrolase [Fimbriimonadaceae bacterium]|nr:nucleoside hydrolase [Fimbriimonadaceae bacterium]